MSGDAPNEDGADAERNFYRLEHALSGAQEDDYTAKVLKQLESLAKWEADQTQNRKDSNASSFALSGRVATPPSLTRLAADTGGASMPSPRREFLLRWWPAEDLKSVVFQAREDLVAARLFAGQTLQCDWSNWLKGMENGVPVEAIVANPSAPLEKWQFKENLRWEIETRVA